MKACARLIGPNATIRSKAGPKLKKAAIAPQGAQATMTENNAFITTFRVGADEGRAVAAARPRSLPLERRDPPPGVALPRTGPGHGDTPALVIRNLTRS